MINCNHKPWRVKNGVCERCGTVVLVNEGTISIESTWPACIYPEEQGQLRKVGIWPFRKWVFHCYVCSKDVDLKLVKLIRDNNESDK